MFVTQLIDLFKNKFKISQISIKYFKVMIKLSSMISKLINVGQICVIQIDSKTTYLVNVLYKSTRV